MVMNRNSRCADYEDCAAASGQAIATFVMAVASKQKRVSRPVDDRTVLKDTLGGATPFEENTL